MSKTYSMSKNLTITKKRLQNYKNEHEAVAA